jgi:prepilin peptidase dependent protein B
MSESHEQFAFRWEQDNNGVGVIRMQVAANTWETITDPATLNIPNATSFTVQNLSQPVDIREACAKTCVGTTCPVLLVRQYRVTITGQALNDATVRRTLTSRVRVRNDEVTGTCPA